MSSLGALIANDRSSGKRAKADYHFSDIKYFGKRTLSVLGDGMRRGYDLMKKRFTIIEDAEDILSIWFYDSLYVLLGRPGSLTPHECVVKRVEEGTVFARYRQVRERTSEENGERSWSEGSFPDSVFTRNLGVNDRFIWYPPSSGRRLRKEDFEIG